jgi:hypothetical protein
MDILAVYAGLAVMLIGFISIIKPLRFLRIRNRRMTMFAGENEIRGDATFGIKMR